VAGVKEKDEDFRDRIRAWDVTEMMETWIEKRD